MKRDLFKKCTAVLCSAIMMGSVIPYMPVYAESRNLVSNSTFDSGTSGWATYYQTGGVCSLGTDSGRLALKISSTGDVGWAVQVYYDIIPLHKNGVYRLKYDISSTADRSVDGMIQQNGGTYQAYTSKSLSLTSEPQTVEYEFTMKADTDIMARLQFNCGNYGEDLPEHTIYIDNVSLELVDDSKVDYSSIKGYEPSIITNQVGYLTDAKKTAVFKNADGADTFTVVNAETKENVYTGTLSQTVHYGPADEDDCTGDFSAVTEPGTYYITCGDLDDSYTFAVSDNVYDKALNDALRMFYLQRCGTEVVDDTFGHGSCHDTLATVYGTSEKIDVSGGWHDAGDYGRYVVPGAKAVADLMYAYLNKPEMFTDSVGIPESGNGTPDVLDEVRYELTWMMKMQDASGGVHHKVTCAAFPAYVMPEEETDELIVTPVTSTATATLCGAMALAYEVYLDVDKTFAESCLASAKDAWNWLESNPNFLYKNPSDIVTGAYEDTSDREERYWAAAQLWRATGEETYRAAAEKISVQTGMDTGHMGDYGSIAIVTRPGADTKDSLYVSAKKSILSQADSFASRSQSSPYGVSITTFYWGSNMHVADAGILLQYAYGMTGDEKYKNAAAGDQDYILGCNPLGICFLSSSGTVSPQHPHHRPSMAQDTPMPGMVAGGVGQFLEDSAVKAYCSDAPAMKRYVDHQESYSTNEITIYWNSPFIYLLTFAGEENESVKGDVNADGVFDVADVVALQKWILAMPDAKLADWKAGDLCGDGKLNVLDLCLMKRMLVNG